jgi:hypothetical protein
MDTSRRLDIRGLQTLAIDRGGRLLSTDYVNSETKMLWQCKEGHEWMATAEVIKRDGYWCPMCARGKPDDDVRRKASVRFTKRQWDRLRAHLYKNDITFQSFALDAFAAKIDKFDS